MEKLLRLRGSIIYEQIEGIAKEDRKRVLEVSSFYKDLEDSIGEVSKYVKNGGKVFYVVGNRTVSE